MPAVGGGEPRRRSHSSDAPLAAKDEVMEERQQILADYVLEYFNGNPVAGVNASALNDLVTADGIRISVAQAKSSQPGGASSAVGPTNTLQTTQGAVIQATSKIHALDYKGGMPAEGVSGLDTKGPPNVTDLLYVTVEQAHSAAEPAKGTFNILVFSPLSAQPVLVIERPVKNHFKSIKVFDGQLTLLGSVERISGLLNHKLVVMGPDNATLYSMKGTKFSTWTDLVLRDGKSKLKTGVITKRWCPEGAATKETSAGGIYDVIFPTGSILAQRALLLASALFMDMLWFDKTV